MPRLAVSAAAMRKRRDFDRLEVLFVLEGTSKCFCDQNISYKVDPESISHDHSRIAYTLVEKLLSTRSGVAHVKPCAE
jgi:hypothetical protein